ncbi:MAG TPA: 16S rRNA (cytosine(1402)-N(4))-methyltransferase RsmH [Phycisphaerae bacterium]|nr:16S rRNA (cytosine(1402)-N(4))-methyltransferase RsmH [Phycisphaerae bacterium]HNU45517.1 16S rRNA (cytosine(1402)-N(4))-methyltransferase RsmH [Phycisphaerae bacterium]
MAGEPPQPEDSAAEHPRPRRRRYSGTHPRRYEQRYKELQPDDYPGMQAHVRAQGRTPAGTHVPVLVDEIISALAPAAGELVADCTLGSGGHASEFLQRIGPAGRLVGLDVDGEQLWATARRLKQAGLAVRGPESPDAAAGPVTAALVSLHRCHFAGLGKVLRSEGLTGFDVVFADLGVSSMQLDDPRRGFGFKHDGPLDMRMDERAGRTAADLLASLAEDELSAALWELADEPDHERIARLVMTGRGRAPLTRTRQLVGLVLRAKGLTQEAWRRQRADQPTALHPAARTFQALRILVNDELHALEQLLRVAPYCLRPEGRIGIISFHSGEDRRVAEAFRCGLEEGVYATADEPIRPTPHEVASNPRSRSALFRWARRTRG